MATVTIYTTPTCVYCRAAKAFFQETKSQYTEKDVATDEKARDEMIQRSGQMGVPIIDIDGKLIIGFDKPKISELLDIK